MPALDPPHRAVSGAGVAARMPDHAPGAPDRIPLGKRASLCASTARQLAAVATGILALAIRPAAAPNIAPSLCRQKAPGRGADRHSQTPLHPRTRAPCLLPTGIVRGTPLREGRRVKSGARSSGKQDRFHIHLRNRRWGAYVSPFSLDFVPRIAVVTRPRMSMACDRAWRPMPWAFRRSRARRSDDAGRSDGSGRSARPLASPPVRAFATTVAALRSPGQRSRPLGGARRPGLGTADPAWAGGPSYRESLSRFPASPKERSQHNLS